jgi:hypothetical protein
MSTRLLFAAVLAGLVLVVSLPASAMTTGITSKVPLDVDVYDQPGGAGKPRDKFLKRGSEIILMKETEDHWCQVVSGKDPVPGGKGWIWCGKGDDGKDYSLKSVAADKPETDMQVVEAKCPEGMEIEVNGPPLICREKLSDGTTKCTKVTVADGKLVLDPIGQCPAM